MDPTPPPPTYQKTDTQSQDLETLRRMAAGDQAALGELYDRWGPLLHRLLWQLLRDDDDVEETLEETFWQAWRQAGRYEDARGSVGTWLTMMARSRALDRVRARGRAREASLADLPEPAEDAAAEAAPAGPLAAAEAGERQALVRRAVARLPAEQRQTIELAFFAGLSQTEIAERLGQPLGTVKTRARLAMQKLREMLQILREDTP